MPKEPARYIQCHQVKIGDNEWVHISGCWAAIQDPACCTCDSGSELERAQQARREAEAYIEKLHDRAHERTERLNRMFQNNKKLHAEMRKLEQILAKQTA